MSNPQRGGDYVLVPREPTQAMIDAAMHSGFEGLAEHLRDDYAAMLAAAPQPPSSPVDSGEAVTELIVKWRHSATHDRFGGEANRLRECANELEAAITHRLTAKPDQRGND